MKRISGLKERRGFLRPGVAGATDVAPTLRARDRGLLPPGQLTYFTSNIFLFSTKLPILNRYRYTPVATCAPWMFRPSHVTAC